MIICTCGGTFRIARAGDAAIIDGKAYSADTLRCRKCSAMVVKTVDVPMSLDPAVITEKLRERGHAVYEVGA